MGRGDNIDISEAVEDQAPEVEGHARPYPGTRMHKKAKGGKTEVGGADRSSGVPDNADVGTGDEAQVSGDRSQRGNG